MPRPRGAIFWLAAAVLFVAFVLAWRIAFTTCALVAILSLIYGLADLGHDLVQLFRWLFGRDTRR